MLSGTPIGRPSWRHDNYMPSYHFGEINHCPACGRHNWIVGRLMAECAFCTAALPLEHVHGYGSMQRVSRQRISAETPAVEIQRVA